MPILPKHRVGLDYDQMKILTHLVEILFVIAIFCGGRRKIDCQGQLSRYGLPDTLSRLFDMMDWTPGHRQGHGPHGTLKIEIIENVVKCVTILDCNYRQNYFSFVHFLFYYLFL